MHYKKEGIPDILSGSKGPLVNDVTTQGNIHICF